MKICILVVLIFVLQSCKESICNWKGGEITEYGTYCNDEFKVKVYEESNYLKYEVRNKKENVIIEQNMNISVVHRWGLFLDNDNNLWVFSSDIGDSVWKRDSLTGEYNNKNFHHWLTRDSMPIEVYSSSMKRFIR